MSSAVVDFRRSSWKWLVVALVCALTGVGILGFFLLDARTGASEAQATADANRARIAQLEADYLARTGEEPPPATSTTTARATTARGAASPGSSPTSPSTSLPGGGPGTTTTAPPPTTTTSRPPPTTTTTALVQTCVQGRCLP